MLEYLNRHGTARVAELAARFEVSEMTVHRDLQAVAATGLVRKVHGGAVANHVTEIPFRARTVYHPEEKRAVARRAAQLVAPGMTLFLSPGTTIAEFARALPEDALTVITNSLPIAQDLTQRSAHEIVLTGGTVRRYAEALVGPAAQSVLTEAFIHIAFIAVTGIHLKAGFSVYSESEAEVLRAAIKAARKTVLLTDSSKFGKVMGPVVLPLYAVHAVVCDEGVPDAYRRFFERNDIVLELVQVPAVREEVSAQATTE